jgi:hypothetical protein
MMDREDKFNLPLEVNRFVTAPNELTILTIFLDYNLFLLQIKLKVGPTFLAHSSKSYASKHNKYNRDCKNTLVHGMSLPTIFILPYSFDS